MAGLGSTGCGAGVKSVGKGVISVGVGDSMIKVGAGDSIANGAGVSISVGKGVGRPTPCVGASVLFVPAEAAAMVAINMADFMVWCGQTNEIEAWSSNKSDL